MIALIYDGDFPGVITIYYPRQPTAGVPIRGLKFNDSIWEIDVEVYGALFINDRQAKSKLAPVRCLH